MFPLHDLLLSLRVTVVYLALISCSGVSSVCASHVDIFKTKMELSSDGYMCVSVC